MTIAAMRIMTVEQIETARVIASRGISNTVLFVVVFEVDPSIVVVVVVLVVIVVSEKPVG